MKDHKERDVREDGWEGITDDYHGFIGGGGGFLGGGGDC